MNRELRIYLCMITMMLSAILVFMSLWLSDIRDLLEVIAGV